MKKILKVQLEPEDEKNLKSKMKQLGFTGRGSLRKFLEKISREDIVFLDENVKKMLKVLSPSILGTK